MDFTCGLVDKFRDIVLDLTSEQLRYLIYYHRNMEQFNEQLEQLTLKRISIQHQKEEAENNVEQIEEEVQSWLNKVDEIWEKVQMLLEKGRDKTECGITSCPNPWLRYKLSKRAKAMAQEISEIFVNTNFTRVSYRVPPPSLIELPNIVKNEGIDSREQIKSQIIGALRDPSVKMVGLFGLGGVGKTTIAKDVTKEEEIQKMFKKVIMAIVSQEKNIGKIQDQIIDKLGMKLTERTEEVKAFQLCERLKQEKNMLLILDDLWEELDLGKVGVPFIDVEKYGKNNEGCKILLTSRNETLLSNHMKCQKIIKVGVLSKDESWELFERIVELSIDSSMESVATEIVQRCGGLPLAIATAAKALKVQKIDGWKDYIRRMKHPLTRTVTGIKEVDTILRLSYDPLSQENKHIFLLSAMLSHDPSIEDLLMHSVGLDILNNAENMEEAYNGISTSVSKLKSLNLFLDSNISGHHFTIHDVFRDVALSIISDEELHAFIVRHTSLNEWPDENKLECCRGIFLQESDITSLPEGLHGPVLEFFLLNSKNVDLAIPNMFFKSSNKLKLLAFTNVHFSSLPSLWFLQKLKALCLHSCVLEDITEVGRLTRLKVLSLAHSKIERLPIELVELTSLQMLNLSHCSKLKEIPHKLLSSLKKLEVLYMRNSFDRWNDEQSIEANENTSLDELRELPISSLDIHIPDVSVLPDDLFLHMKLERYKILIGKHWKWSQVNDETSKILRIEIESSIHLNAGIRKLMEGVEDLYLYGTNGHENVFYKHDVTRFPCLKHLQIKSNDDIKCIFPNLAHHEEAFPVLQSLELKNLKALEDLCEGPGAIEFRALHTLIMGNLPALTGELSLKDRAINNASNKILKSLFNNKVLFPKLEILELSNLNSMIAFIWNDQLPHNSFSNLKTFTVRSCGFVKLVPFHVLKSLHKLEELEVEECDELEMLFDFEDLNHYETMLSSSVVVPLKKLELSFLPKLKNVWSNHYYQGNVSFPSLRSVEVHSCKSLTSIFPASIAKDMLSDLQELSISGCDIDVIVAKDQVLESVAVTFEFPRLTSLRLAYLSKLRNFYPNKHTLELSNLHLLSIKCCDELEIFEKEVSSSLEILEDETTPDSKYPLLSHKVIDKLEDLTLGGKIAEMIGSDRFLMYHFPKVKLLDLSAKKARTVSYRSLLESFPKLEDLTLSEEFMEAFGGDYVAPSLKLALYNNSILRSLSPSLVSPPNLTHLQVISCIHLTSLMTSSTARSLVHLTRLSIVYCSEIEEIITKQEREDDEDKEIFFSKMEFLELYNLPRLKRFCGYNCPLRFPLLEHVTIRDCPHLTMFCPGDIHAPRLHSIRVHEYPPKDIWKTNLNNTIQHLFTFQEVISTTESMMLNAKNVTMIMDVFPEVTDLSVESFQDEGVTFPYRSLERFPKMDYLSVVHSSFEEIFPSQEEIIAFEGRIPSFANLYIAYLDKLKSIWKDDSHLPPIHQNLEDLEVKSCCNLAKLAPSSASFGNLQWLFISGCHQLIHVVAISTAKSLVSLIRLEIHDCTKMEEIVLNEINEDVEGAITFKELREIELTEMPSLKMFSSQNHSFEFPKLEEIKIIGCPKMKMLCSGVLETPKMSKVKIEEHDIKWEDERDLNKIIQRLSSEKDSVNM